MVHQADVVVVGAGSAGAVLASRLSESASTSVVLVEAGADYRSADTVAAIRSTEMSPSLEIDRLGEYYWLDLRARRTPDQPAELYWQGRGVGGSSAINGQVALRPPPGDFDRWEQEGCQGWGWDEVLPYFVRLEDDGSFGDAPFHGRGGPIPVARVAVEDWSSLDLAVRDALLDRGLVWQPDLNAPGSTGCGPYPFNGRDGVRVSTNDAYLEPARSRPNLAIRSHTLVERVLFAGTRAVGVQVLGPDGSEQLRADEVVLCGGAVGSGSILLRSGVGPPDHLHELDIPVIVSLPVGCGVQDHANVALSFEMNPDPRQGAYRPACCARFTTGLAGGADDDAFVAACGPFAADDARGGVTAWLNQPLARGALRLASADPTQSATMDLNLLGDERDRIRFRRILRDLCELLREPIVREVIATEPRARDGTPLAEIERMSDRELDRWTSTVVRDVAHLVASCPMGDPSRAATVVDSDCRVLGVDGLRVVDASVLPSVPRANTNLSAIMLAERMGDLLRR
jgi:choline dehydrogenase